MLTGLSPRLRGNPFQQRRYPRDVRSIPAPAGEPYSGGSRLPGCAVYPRACGGTSSLVRPASLWFGLSPRLLGTIAAVICPELETGLSPRLRGNPATDEFLGVQWTPVYPRACGGTGSDGIETCQAMLKVYPRACRGNRAARRPGQFLGRSIPSPAGEPDGNDGVATHVAVYPRACGGTSTVVSDVSLDENGVYPRACGGTTSPSSRLRSYPRWGLSPRLRGNLAMAPRPRSDSAGGSIPAPAGEPIVRAMASLPVLCAGLSPRLRGNPAIDESPCKMPVVAGLSPRLRGNREWGSKRTSG